MRCINLIFFSGIIRFYMLDYIIFSRFGSSYSTSKTLEIKISDIFLNIVPIVSNFLISFKVGFTFKWIPCYTWFWCIISFSSNSHGIINHSSFTVIFLCDELLLDIPLFVLVLYFLFLNHSFFANFIFFAIWFFIYWKSINFVINQLLECLLIFKVNILLKYLKNPMKF